MNQSYCPYQSHGYTFRTSNTSSILKAWGRYLISVPGESRAECLILYIKNTNKGEILYKEY